MEQLLFKRGLISEKTCDNYIIMEKLHEHFFEYDNSKDLTKEKPGIVGHLLDFTVSGLNKINPFSLSKSNGTESK